jgi:hypothetical protein
MSRKFTLEDYEKINPTQKLIVNEWLDKYDLQNVHTVIRSDDESLICMGISVFKLIQKGKIFTTGYDSKVDMVVAVFDYDDFPWEVLDNA